MAKPKVGIKATGEALRKAGVTKEKAATMTPRELVEAAEEHLGEEATDWNDTATAVRGLK